MTGFKYVPATKLPDVIWEPADDATSDMKGARKFLITQEWLQEDLPLVTIEMLGPYSGEAPRIQQVYGVDNKDAPKDCVWQAIYSEREFIERRLLPKPNLRAWHLI